MKIQFAYLAFASVWAMVGLSALANGDHLWAVIFLLAFAYYIRFYLKRQSRIHFGAANLKVMRMVEEYSTRDLLGVQKRIRCPVPSHSDAEPEKNIIKTGKNDSREHHCVPSCFLRAQRVTGTSERVT